MIVVIEEVELLDQETAKVTVSVDGKLHTLKFYAEALFDDDACIVIRRALQEKLQAEQETAWLVGMSFEMRRKAYGEIQDAE